MSPPPPPPTPFSSLQLHGWILEPGRDAHARRRRSLGISLFLQVAVGAGLVTALRWQPLSLPAPALQRWQPVAELVLTPPPRFPAPAVRPPRFPPPAPELPHRLKLVAVPLAPPPPAPAMALRPPAPAPPRPALAAPSAVVLPAPVPRPAPVPVAAVQLVHLGSFAPPAGLPPAPLNSVATTTIGQFGSAHAAAPTGSASAVPAAGFGTLAVAAPPLPPVRVAAAGFGTAAAAASAPAPLAALVLHAFDPVPRVPFAPAAAAAAPPDAVPPEVLEWPTPLYTAAAAARHIEGDVVLQVRLGAHGEVEVLRVVRGLGYGLDEAAETAARRLIFHPARRRGEAVDATVLVHINFKLAD